MKVLVFLCVTVALATADSEKCGPLQRLKVKQQWSVAFGTAHHRLDIGTALWRGIFRQAPNAVDDLFARVNGKDLYSGMFQAHSMRVLGGLNMVISVLDDEKIVEGCLEHLAGQHKERNIPANYFQIFKQTLMKVVPAAIGRCFDREAWDACFDLIIEGISNY